MPEWGLHLGASRLYSPLLTGGLPLLSRVRRTNRDRYTRLPSGKQAHLRSVTLTFNTSDVSFGELRKIYDGIKTYMGGKGIQAPTFEDLELWQLVEDLGGPPEPYRGVKDFLLGVLKKWKHGYAGDTPLKSWEGLQKRYRRVSNRLGIE